MTLRKAITDMIDVANAAEHSSTKSTDDSDEHNKLKEEFDPKRFLSSRQFFKVSKNDFEVKTMLGEGSFSKVFEVYLFDKKTMEYDRSKTFALKRLKSEVTRGPLKKTASADLALETKIMSELDHENIIRLRGTKSGDMFQSLVRGDFFIVMDVLVESLESRLEAMQKKHIPIFRSNIDVYTNLCDIALGISCGMEYLHGKDIIFRDLKPANIGFDRNGNIKLFDFGLARPMSQLEGDSGQMRPPAGALHLTGGAGTPRYMAPEVAKMERYGFPADVYSFSLLLYQLVTNRIPFRDITDPDEFREKVVHEDLRPSLKGVANLKIRELIGRSWSEVPHNRPTFSTVRETIDEVLHEMEKVSGSSSKTGRKTLFPKRVNGVSPIRRKGRSSSDSRIKLENSGGINNKNSMSNSSIPVLRRMTARSEQYDELSCSSG